MRKQLQSRHHSGVFRPWKRTRAAVAGLHLLIRARLQAALRGSFRCFDMRPAAVEARRRAAGVARALGADCVDLVQRHFEPRFGEGASRPCSSGSSWHQTSSAFGKRASSCIIDFMGQG